MPFSLYLGLVTKHFNPQELPVMARSKSRKRPAASADAEANAKKSKAEQQQQEDAQVVETLEENGAQEEPSILSTELQAELGGKEGDVLVIVGKKKKGKKKAQIEPELVQEAAKMSKTKRKKLEQIAVRVAGILKHQCYCGNGLVMRLIMRVALLLYHRRARSRKRDERICTSRWSSRVCRKTSSSSCTRPPSSAIARRCVSDSSGP